MDAEDRVQCRTPSENPAQLMSLASMIESEYADRNNVRTLNSSSTKTVINCVPWGSYSNQAQLQTKHCRDRVSLSRSSFFYHRQQINAVRNQMIVTGEANWKTQTSMACWPCKTFLASTQPTRHPLRLHIAPGCSLGREKAKLGIIAALRAWIGFRLMPNWEASVHGTTS